MISRASQDRVTQHTADKVNERIHRMTDQSIEYHALHPEYIDQRLNELEQEWDIERILETNASTLILAGLALGIGVNRKWLALPLGVAGFLLQHAIQGWCPPLPALRRLGVRTKNEILRERTALRVLKGDFDTVPAVSPDEKLQAAKRLMEG